MKDFFVYRTVRRLTLPLIVVICVLMAAVPARAGGGKAQVVVGFVGSPPPGFQNVLLNVQAVRINKKNNPPPTGGGWQRIPTPPGIGGRGQNAELQIDLNASQNIPQLFNTTGVKPNIYHTAELLLDPNNPGVLIPNCPQSPGGGEGCINYPITLNGGNLISVNDTSGLVAPSKNQLGVLMLNVQVAVNQAPTTPGGPFSVTITMTTVPPGSVQGIVTGSVTVNASGSAASSGKIRALGVTAEAIGTNTAIATSRVTSGGNCAAKAPGGCYTLALPAAGGSNTSTSNGFGTLYDLAVAGGGDTYAAQRLLPLYPGGSPTAVDFTVKGPQMLGNISGTVTDLCTGKAVIGATLQLLIPPDLPNPNSAADCVTNPEQCVAVATANTNNTGGFPLPGTLLVPSQFDNVPVLASGKSYAMQITAPGYDNLVVLAKPSPASKGNGSTCSVNGGAFGKCNLTLNTGTINGTIPITPPISGQTTLVQVFAEDAGTNNVVGALTMPVIVSSSNPGTVTFPTLNVPTSGTFDLFATTIDLYQGGADPYQGHTIAVLPGVTGPESCQSVTVAFDQTIDCIGHGSITGQVQNPNLGTSVVLSKDNVQLSSSIVENQAPLPDPNRNYSFCVPADTYDVQRFQLPEPSPDVTPLAMPTPSADGPLTSVTIPPAPLVNGPGPTPTVTPTGGPTPTATPSSLPTPKIKCPTTCSNPGGSCPGICNNAIAPQL